MGLLLVLLTGPAVQPVQHSRGPVCQHIEDAARIDTHVAQASKSVLEKMLLAHRAAVAEREPNQGFTCECADPEDPVGRIRFERKPRGSDRHRHPKMHRLLQSPTDTLSIANGTPGIVDAVTDQRPAIVVAGKNEIELVASSRAVLVGP